MTTSGLVPIGELASATGVAVSALRHYDELGLIAPTARVGGKRWFSQDTVGRVRFVRRAQRCGFSLAEIRAILDDTSGATRQIAADKITALRARQLELSEMITMLGEMQSCGCTVVATCPAVTDPC